MVISTVQERHCSDIEQVAVASCFPQFSLIVKASSFQRWLQLNTPCLYKDLFIYLKERVAQREEEAEREREKRERKREIENFHLGVYF